MGLFQGLMPVIGVHRHRIFIQINCTFQQMDCLWNILYTRAKFILESFQQKQEEIQCIGLKCLISLGIATSIDALVSGATIKLTHTSLFNFNTYNRDCLFHNVINRIFGLEISLKNFHQNILK